MFCNKCGTKIAEGNNFCAQCGTHIEQTKSNSAVLNENIENNLNAQEGLSSTRKGFFGKLSHGDYGLAKTYWLYGFVVNMVINVVTRPIESIGVLLLILIPYIIYEVFVLMGVWRASDRYTGSKIWAIFAKIATVLGALSLLFLMFMIVSALLT